WTAGNGWREWDAPLNIIAGESHYQHSIWRLVPGSEPREHGYLVPVEVDLSRDPKNKYDRNAIRADVAGSQVGFIARDIAESLAPSMDRFGVKAFRCCGLVRGGSDRAPALGVHLWIGRRSTVGPPVGVSGEPGDAEVGWPPSEWEGTD
ncbi:MAG: HIRAN domain-containing protein, partial [Thermoleophilia bacterium]